MGPVLKTTIAAPACPYCGKTVEICLHFETNTLPIEHRARLAYNEHYEREV